MKRERHAMIIMIKCIFMIGDLVQKLAALIVCVFNNAAVFVEICSRNKRGAVGSWQQKRPAMLHKTRKTH